MLNLHRKIALVLAVNVMYESVAYAAQKTAGMYINWQRNILPTAALAIQVPAYVITIETLMYSARGWGTTFCRLSFCESGWIRVIVVTWVAMFIALGELQLGGLPLAIVTGLLWVGIIAMTYLWTDDNFSIYPEYAMYARQLGFPESPFVSKRELFREFRWILWTYAGFSLVGSLVEWGTGNFEYLPLSGHQLLPAAQLSPLFVVVLLAPLSPRLFVP